MLLQKFHIFFRRYKKEKKWKLSQRGDMGQKSENVFFDADPNSII